MSWQYCSPFKSQAENLHALAISKRLLELRDDNNWTPQELRLGVYLHDEPLPIQLHETAFVAVIEAQGTDAQKRLWVPRCYNYEILGCYA